MSKHKAKGYSGSNIDAIHAIMQGYRTVYENNAISKEDSRVTLRDEFNCRVRMSIRAKPMIPYIISQLIKAKKSAIFFKWSAIKSCGGFCGVNCFCCL